MNKCCVDLRFKILKRLDDLRWEEHNKGPDEKIGDNSPAVIAKCYQVIEEIMK